MARTVYCPKCEADISGSHEPAEPDVGIINGGWYCEDCDEFVAEQDVHADDERPDFLIPDEQPF